MASNNESDRRTVVDWRGRKQKQRMFGIIKLIILVAILGAVAGLGIRYYPTIMASLSPAKDSPVPPPPPPKKKIATPPPPAPKKRVEPQVVERAPAKPIPVEKPKTNEPQFVEAEEQRAKKLIEQGNQALMSVKFAAAKKAFGEAAQLRASKDTHAAAEKLAHKAGQYDLATSHVSPSKFATADTSWVLNLRGGRTLRGLIVGEQSQMITLLRVSEENPAATGTVRVPIPRLQIEERREVPLAERQKEFLDLLTQLESSLNLGPGARSTDYYDLIVLSKRLGLNDKCIAYLEAAYLKAPDGALGTLYRKLIIDRALERATLLAVAGRKIQAEGVLNELTRKTLPGYGKAEDAADAFRMEVLAKIKDDFRSTIALKASKPAPVAAAQRKKPKKTAKELASAATSREAGGADVEIVVSNDGVNSSNSRANDFIQKGNKLYEEGMAEYRKYRQGTQGGNNAVLKAAMVKLEKAVDLYGKALDIDKRNKAVSDRQVEANMIVYACKKYQTL